MGIEGTIEPNSLQINADDLLAGPKTITVTEVIISDDKQQPVSIRFHGDNGKPYKPCKSMRRVLVRAWGSEKSYPGRKMSLFCDPNVTFGADKVGGIRISHLSHIDEPLDIPLTVTRGRRKPYHVGVIADDGEVLTRLRAEFHEFAETLSEEDRIKAFNYLKENNTISGYTTAIKRARQIIEKSPERRA